MDNDTPKLSVDTVAARLDVSRSLIYGLIEDGILKAHRIGRKNGKGIYRISERQYQEYLAVTQVNPVWQSGKSNAQENPQDTKSITKTLTEVSRALGAALTPKSKPKNTKRRSKPKGSTTSWAAPSPTSSVKH
ncbi:DNA binding domain-containing protein, excisionase family [Methylomagnum ishizawai]|uniref:DNA binding domain-containing protein, excisionase family n=1 Tax=Methylomagnum ishizawai TaxID=1760988 RepID=A0A1Y6D8J5_9GAMM|nr:excisionase family DNA-binding protein [Methylomagnum ishizawai]SMF97073.1 DNA binding domain-containing protein, excisionase family [Methylomagnum ishizawai]